MLIGDSRTSSANGACGRQDRHDSHGMRAFDLTSSVLLGLAFPYDPAYSDPTMIVRGNV
jgi:hypothetical protein